MAAAKLDETQSLLDQTQQELMETTQQLNESLQDNADTSLREAQKVITKSVLDDSVDKSESESERTQENAANPKEKKRGGKRLDRKEEALRQNVQGVAAAKDALPSAPLAEADEGMGGGVFGSGTGNAGMNAVVDSLSGSSGSNISSNSTESDIGDGTNAGSTVSTAAVGWIGTSSEDHYLSPSALLRRGR